MTRTRNVGHIPGSHNLHRLQHLRVVREHGRVGGGARSNGRFKMLRVPARANVRSNERDRPQRAIAHARMSAPPLR